MIFLPSLKVSVMLTVLSLHWFCTEIQNQCSNISSYLPSVLIEFSFSIKLDIFENLVISLDYEMCIGGVFVSSCKLS